MIWKTFSEATRIWVEGDLRAEGSWFDASGDTTSFTQGVMRVDGLTVQNRRASKGLCLRRRDGNICFRGNYADSSLGLAQLPLRRK